MALDPFKILWLQGQRTLKFLKCGPGNIKFITKVVKFNLLLKGGKIEGVSYFLHLLLSGKKNVVSRNWLFIFFFIFNFAIPCTATCQAFLSITKPQSLLKLMSIKSVMPSNHLILRHPLLLLPSIFPSIRVFSNESVLYHKILNMVTCAIQKTLVGYLFYI